MEPQAHRRGPDAMRPLLAAALVLLAGLAVAQPASSQQAVAGTVNVGFHGWPGLQADAALYGGTVAKALPELRAVTVRTPDVEGTLRSARSSPDVRYAEVDGRAYGGYVPAEPLASQQWAIGAMNLTGAWDATRGAAAVIVAVIDSGLLRTHEEFDGARFLQGTDIARGDGVPDDECNHGTPVTSLLAASMHNRRGMAGAAQVSILPIKVLKPPGTSCSTTMSEMAEGVTYAANAGADILSMSIVGSSSSTMFNDAISYAHGRGLLIVASAGNTGTTCGTASCVSRFWIDNADKVLIVGAAGPTERSRFSSVGPEVDLVAPGEGLLAASTGASNTYSSGLQGTSFAAPHVSGVAALLLSGTPSLTAEQLAQRLMATARDLGPAGRDPEYGAGMVDAGRAVAGWTTPFDAQFRHPAGTSTSAVVHVDANHPVTAVQARSGTGAWTPMQLRADGAWAATGVSYPDGALVQFRAQDPQGATDLSGCFAWPQASPAPCPGASSSSGTGGSFAAPFTGFRGSGWWVQANVGTNGPDIRAVEVRVDGGAWRPLTKQSWGPTAWAGSYQFPQGSILQMRATASTGQMDLSSCRQWIPPANTDAAIVACPGAATSSTNPPLTVASSSTSASAFDATFTGVRGNEWWQQVTVTSAGATLSKVDVRIGSGAWQPMAKQSWGGWAASYRAVQGSVLQFRATSGTGSTDLSDCYSWIPPGTMDAAKVTCPGSAAPSSSSSSPSPSSSAFAASFSPKSVGNDWWVEASVAGNQPIAKVEVQRNGGAWVQLDRTDWGAWAKSIHAPNGTQVVFKATATTGAVAVSPPVTWT